MGGRARLPYQRSDALVVRQLAALRVRAGWTQAEVAGRIGTTQSAISELEGGVVSPTLALVLRYAAEVGMDVVLTPLIPNQRGVD